MWEDEVRIPPPGYRSAPQRRAAEARRTVAAASAIGAVLVLCVIGYLAARTGGSEGVPVIQAPPGSVKVKPDDPGGLQVNSQTSALLGNSGSGGGANLAPAPEAPDPAALAAAADQEQAPATRAAPAPSPAPSAAVISTPTVRANSMVAVPVPSVPEIPAPAAPKQTVLNVPPSAPSAVTQNLAQENDLPASSPDHDHVRVQLAALASQSAAVREWERLAHRMPTLFEGRRPIFAEAHVSGHTFWRVRTAGFATVPDAARFCSDVRAQGAACTVALF